MLVACVLGIGYHLAIESTWGVAEKVFGAFALAVSAGFSGAALVAAIRRAWA
jgi:hypothetical protein